MQLVTNKVLGISICRIILTKCILEQTFLICPQIIWYKSFVFEKKFSICFLFSFLDCQWFIIGAKCRFSTSIILKANARENIPASSRAINYEFRSWQYIKWTNAIKYGMKWRHECCTFLCFRMIKGTIKRNHVYCLFIVMHYHYASKI